MTRLRGSRSALPLAVVGILLFSGTGCGLLARSKEEPARVALPPPPPPPTPIPAPPVPPPRPSGARIADEETLKFLVPGKTARDEVRERFGLPQEVVVAPGVETFIYFRDRTSGWISRTTRRVEMLTIRFDGKGILKDFEYRYAGK